MNKSFFYSLVNLMDFKSYNTKCKTTNENIRDILDLKNERISNRKHAEFESQLSVVVLNKAHYYQTLAEKIESDHLSLYNLCHRRSPSKSICQKMFIHNY